MLMPGVGQGLEHGRGRRRDGFASRPDQQRPSADVIVGDDRDGAELGDELLGHFEAAVRSVRGTVKEMSVVPWCEVFWTIMSTLIARSARPLNTEAAMPGWSGTPVIVTLASVASS